MFNFIYSRNAKLFEPLLCHFELNCQPADLSFVHLPLKTAKYGRIKLGARQQYVSLLQGDQVQGVLYRDNSSSLLCVMWRLKAIKHGYLTSVSPRLGPGVPPPRS